MLTINFRNGSVRVFRDALPSGAQAPLSGLAGVTHAVQDGFLYVMDTTMNGPDAVLAAFASDTVESWEQSVSPEREAEAREDRAACVERGARLREMQKKLGTELLGLRDEAEDETRGSH